MHLTCVGFTFSVYSVDIFMLRILSRHIEKGIIVAVCACFSQMALTKRCKWYKIYYIFDFGVINEQ